LIVDDDESMKNGLEAMLASEPDFEVVGVASDGMTAMRSTTEL
jgi:chemotaxis response regulator CheB